MGQGAVVDAINFVLIAGQLQKCIGLHVYSDGGYNKGEGSATVVVTGVRWIEDEIRHNILGVRGSYIFGDLRLKLN